MVYAGYFFGQYPCGWLIGRFPAQKVMAISVFLWGLMVIIMTQSRDYSSALAVRFIMGIFEAAVTPGLTLMTGFWYTRREIPLRQCIWYSSLGWGGIVRCIHVAIPKADSDIIFLRLARTSPWAFPNFPSASSPSAGSLSFTLYVAPHLRNLATKH